MPNDNYENDVGFAKKNSKDFAAYYNYNEIFESQLMPVEGKDKFVEDIMIAVNYLVNRQISTNQFKSIFDDFVVIRNSKNHCTPIFRGGIGAKLLGENVPQKLINGE